MTIVRRPIPVLPERPRMPAAMMNVQRSYPVGRKDFSWAVAQRPFELLFSTDTYFPSDTQVCLDTTLNTSAPHEWTTVPFERQDEKTFRCRIIPSQPGLFWFRARYSLDGGLSWIKDPVPDAGVLVDPPQVDALRLYTFIPTVSGTIADWTDDLPRIKAMGFNAVHLLPVTCLDLSQSPYAASDLFDVDHRYLMEGIRGDGLSQLEEFVERARELEIRICFDLVLNHVGVNSTMVKKAPDWIEPDPNSPDGNRRARYSADGESKTWEDLVLINYEHPSSVVRAEVWTYMIEYALFWANYANYTNGFVRFDNLHSGNRGFVEAVARALHEEYPNLGIVAEYFTDEVTLFNTVPDWKLNLVLATPWNYKFVPQLREYLQYVHRVSDQIRHLMPITSHDSGAPAQEFGVAASTIPRYVAAALLGTGATGITQGVEFGKSERINFIGNHAKLNWDDEPCYAKFIGSVNSILGQHRAFRIGGNCEFLDNGHESILAAFRRDPDASSGGFLVVCNFDIHKTQNIQLDLRAFVEPNTPQTGKELLSGREMTFESAMMNLVLAACEAMIIQVVVSPEDPEAKFE